MFSKKRIAIACSAVLALTAGVCLSASASTPTPASQLVNASVILNVTHPQQLASYIRATVTPGDRDYHRFLTVGQFRHQYAPSRRQIGQLVRYLKAYGITVTKIYADHLDVSVSGTAADFNAAFATQLQDHVREGMRFHRPAFKPAWKQSLPSDLAGVVMGVAGLDTRVGRMHPMPVRAVPSTAPRAHATEAGGYPVMVWPKNGTATGVPGEYTVGDVANFYQVNPLYAAGIRGRGRTIGIMTFANFNTADAGAYWSDIGLKVAPNRITKVLVDGGTPIAAGVGDDETSLDVEQSGGLAPQAKVRAYIAPNNNQGGVDVYYAAVSANVADTLSISWGEAEEFYFAGANGGVSETDIMQEINQALMEAAAQGQSVFAAAGDDGAFDAFDEIPANADGTGNGVNAQLTVDFPSSDPYITAAGGTTMKGVLNTGLPLPNGSPFIVDIPQEQVWGWDYLEPFCAAYGLSAAQCGIEFTGGGGGVSSFWRMPYYQRPIRGMTLTQANQPLICETAFACSEFGLTAMAPQIVLTLPANFVGRNVPDLSLNADPETGYVLVDCTDYPEPANPDCAATGFGGTSFVAPQLNGMTALISQASGSRIGFLNPAVYALQATLGYGTNKPFNDIQAGNNWFYHGIKGYDNGSGIGTINAANLARAYLNLDSGQVGQ